MAGGTAADTACALPAWAEALVRNSDDPLAEVLTMVWGPRFDREHALELLTRLPRADGALVQAIHAFGERFDALPPAGQRALRQALLDIADNAPCRASC